MTRLLVQPATRKGPDGGDQPLRVLNPRTMRPIPTDRPTSVPVTEYWARRVRCGDVVVVDPPKPKKTKKTKTKRARK